MAAPETLATLAWRSSRVPGAARALLLDIDGTLAPIVDRPELAKVPRATLSALRRLRETGWGVAFVSGRSARDARRLVPLRGAVVFGAHGLEGPDGPLLPRVAAMRARARLATLAREGARVAAAFEGVRLERKPYGLAFHDRELPASRARAWSRQLRSWLRGQDLDGLEIIVGKRVHEVRPAGAHKGSVAARWPPARDARPGDLSLVAAGDDRTDEDLFAALADRGLTIFVGPAGRRSRARRRLDSPDALSRFLHELARLSRGVRAR